MHMAQSLRFMQRLLLASWAVTLSAGQQLNDDVEESLFRWLERHGGKVGYKLGKDCDECPRGAIATRDFKAEEVIGEVPFNLSILLGLDEEARADVAFNLIVERFTNTKHNETYEPFWASQPGVDEVLAPELFTDELIEMLQSDELEEIVREQLAYSAAVFYGSSGNHKYPGKSLLDVLGGAHVSLEQFRWYIGLVNSRSFVFWRGGEEELLFFFPVLDMINHVDLADRNCHRWEFADLGVWRLIAEKDIEKGQQLYFAYHDDLLHRPDMSLLAYGFVAQRDPPLLAASDLPGFSISEPYEPTPLNDDAHGPRGEHATHKELDRLLHIKYSWPTTLEQDEGLLEKEVGEGGDWRKRTLLQYRVQRKRAVVRTIAALCEELTEL